MNTIPAQAGAPVQPTAENAQTRTPWPAAKDCPTSLPWSIKGRTHSSGKFIRIENAWGYQVTDVLDSNGWRCNELNAALIVESVNGYAALRAECDELAAQIERLTIRGAAYEEAYGIAYQATFQSHTGHWDKTGQHGAGCPECIRAHEARENCDKALRDGLAKLVDRAALAAIPKEPT